MLSHSSQAQGHKQQTNPQYSTDHLVSGHSSTHLPPTFHTGPHTPRTALGQNSPTQCVRIIARDNGDLTENETPQLTLPQKRTTLFVKLQFLTVKGELFCNVTAPPLTWEWEQDKQTGSRCLRRREPRDCMQCKRYNAVQINPIVITGSWLTGNKSASLPQCMLSHQELGTDTTESCFTHLCTMRMISKYSSIMILRACA